MTSTIYQYLLTSYLVPLRLAVIPCFFLRFFFGAGTAFFSSVSVFRFSSGAGCRALCNREDCVAPGRRAYCVKDVKVTSERLRSVRLFYNQRFSIIPTWNAHLCIQHYAFLVLSIAVLQNKLHINPHQITNILPSTRKLHLQFILYISF